MKPLSILFWGGILSKFLGLLREVVFAALFGASEIAGAYRVAFTAFTAPTHALVLETVSGGLVPLYKSADFEDDDAKQSLVIVAVVLGTLVSCLISASLIGCRAGLAKLISSNGPAEMQRLSAEMIFVMAAGVPFYVLGNLLTFIETANGKYMGLSSRPALLNIVTLFAAFIAYESKTPILLAVGLTISHFCFLIWTIHSARKGGSLHFLVPRNLTVYKKSFFLFIANAAPLLLIPIITQLNFVVERIVSSLIGIATLPCLEYARFIADTFLTLVGVPIGLVALAEYSGTRDPKEFKSHIAERINALMILAFPLGVEIFVLSKPIVKYAFQRGAFSSVDAHITALILGTLGLGLGPTVCSYVMLRYLSARLRNKMALGIITIASVANAAFDLMVWKGAGPSALGEGASLYGLLSFGFCFWALGLWPEIKGFLAAACLASAFNLITSSIIGSLDNGMHKVFLSLFLYLLSVGGLCVLWKPGRNIFEPIVSSLLDRVPRI